jgi:hypothetical protein
MKFTQEQSERMYNLLCDVAHAQREYNRGAPDTFLKFAKEAIDDWYVDHCDDEADA